MRYMLLTERYSVGTRLAVTGCVLAGAAACAAAQAATPSHPQAAPLSAARGAGPQAGQRAFVTARRVADRASRQAVVPAAGRAVDASHPDHVIGQGTPAGCTSAAVVRAVAAGGVITFDCGPRPVKIRMTATAKVVNTSHRVVLDGGGKVTLDGGGTTRILYMNTCDAAQRHTTNRCWKQQWPQLVVQNMAFTNAYSATVQARNASYGGGAIFDEGGQLKVVNSVFTGNRCYRSGPDLGGGAIRATGMDMSIPVYIVSDTFTGNSCSNGGALSGLFANFAVYDSSFTGNKAIGTGANPAKRGTPGGGSGGAVYTDGAGYDLLIDGTTMRDNTAREGGGAIFFVVNYGGGRLTIRNSTLVGNTSGAFQNAPGIFDEVNSVVTQPSKSGSSVR